MSTTLPDDATKDNCDAGTDDPEQALLTDLAGVIDKFNDLKGVLGALARLNAAGGLTTKSQSAGTPDDLAVGFAFSTKTAAYTALAADRGKVLDFTTAGVTLSLTAAATLGDNWFCFVRNSASSGNLTIDPNSSETIDGSTTITLGPGEACLVACNGSAFRTAGRVGSGAITTAKLDDGAVTTAKLADDAVTDAKMDDSGVTAGSYTNANITVNAQGRIEAASSGSSTPPADSVGSSQLKETSAETTWVLGRIAGASVGAVGTYALALRTTGAAANPGDTAAGSQLNYATTGGTGIPGVALSGTWRCMGYAHSSGGGTDSTTLWMRIS